MNEQATYVEQQVLPANEQEYQQATSQIQVLQQSHLTLKMKKISENIRDGRQSAHVGIDVNATQLVSQLKCTSKTQANQQTRQKQNPEYQRTFKISTRPENEGKSNSRHDFAAGLQIVMRFNFLRATVRNVTNVHDITFNSFPCFLRLS